MEPFFGALGLVFLAELGDKTQLVAIGLGARHRLAPVLVGVALAYTATTILSVLVGGLLGAALPSRALGLAGGVLFLGFAAWSLRSGDDDAGQAIDASPGRVVASVAVAMFVAELGDKTMLTTATLATQGSPVLVGLGALVGIILSGSVGVLIGRVGGVRLPARTIRIGSAALFALFGMALIVVNL